VNYFEFFDLPISFYPDLDVLKKAYFLKSREFHPDFYTNASQEDQDLALEKSSFNNVAYKTLVDFYSRFKYILESEGLISSDSKEDIPQDFLFEMMDINEQLEDFQLNQNKKGILDIQSQIESVESNMFKSLEHLLKKYPKINSEELEQIKTFYFKRKYIQRIYQKTK